VQQWLTAEDAEKPATLALAVGNDPIDGGQIETRSLAAFGDPASLTGQVAVVGYRNELEGWKGLAPLFSLLEPVESPNAFKAEIVDEFPQAFGIGSEGVSQN
jgi:hypothetical protein